MRFMLVHVELKRICGTSFRHVQVTQDLVVDDYRISYYFALPIKSVKI